MQTKNFYVKTFRIWLCLTTLFFLSNSAISQIDTSISHISLSYKNYLNLVINNNLEYAAEKYNINIADAKIEVAKIFQNPSFAIDWAGEKESNSINGYALTMEFSKTIELGNKRKARINLAKNEKALTNAMLNDFWRNLQADATLDYLTAIKQRYLFEVMQNSYQMMKKISDSDSIRLSLGSIKSIDAIQSKIEAGILFNNLIQMNTDKKKAYLVLSTKISTFNKDTLFSPIGTFEKFEREFNLNELLITALNNRTDLLAAKNTTIYNQNLLKLTKKERIADIDLKIGTSNTYLKTTGVSPTSTEVFAGIAIPLKFSNFNKGEIKIVQHQIEQGELHFKQVELNIQAEVVQAYSQYQSLRIQVNNYNNELIEQSKTVLIGKIYSYTRGETSLLEVLNAQRTYNDLQIAYYETLYNCFASLIELERSVGIWDIDL